MVRVVTSKDEEKIARVLDDARADYDLVALAAYKRSRYEAPLSGCASFALARSVAFWSRALELARVEQQATQIEQTED